MDILSAKLDTNKKLFRNESLLKVMMEIEALLDNFNLYVWKNWVEGEIVGGPFVQRHWVIMFLKYKFEEMPDPRGGMVLTKHGVKVYYKESFDWEPVEIKHPSDFEPGSKVPKMKKVQIWLIRLHFPRHFLENLDIDEYTDNFDDEVIDDIESLIDADTEGLNNNMNNAEEVENGEIPGEEGEQPTL